MPTIYQLDNAPRTDTWGAFSQAAMAEFDRARNKREKEAETQKSNEREDRLSREKNAQALLLADIQYGNKAPNEKGEYVLKPKAIDGKNVLDMTKAERVAAGFPEDPNSLQLQITDMAKSYMLNFPTNPKTKKPTTLQEANDYAVAAMKNRYPKMSDDVWNKFTGMGTKYHWSEFDPKTQAEILKDPNNWPGIEAEHATDGGLDALNAYKKGLPPPPPTPPPSGYSPASSVGMSLHNLGTNLGSKALAFGAQLPANIINAGYDFSSAISGQPQQKQLIDPQSFSNFIGATRLPQAPIVPSSPIPTVGAGLDTAQAMYFGNQQPVVQNPFEGASPQDIYARYRFMNSNQGR